MAIDFKTEASLSIGANFPWQVLASDEVLLPATLAT
jgi:uncharacterized protein (UPF0264 family)